MIPNTHKNIIMITSRVHRFTASDKHQVSSGEVLSLQSWELKRAQGTRVGSRAHTFSAIQFVHYYDNSATRMQKICRRRLYGRPVISRAECAEISLSVTTCLIPNAAYRVVMQRLCRDDTDWNFKFRGFWGGLCLMMFFLHLEMFEDGIRFGSINSKQCNQWDARIMI